MGVPGKNDICVLASWPDTENNIKGKVVASPSPGCAESCEFVFTYGSLKVLQLYTNQLVV